MSLLEKDSYISKIDGLTWYLIRTMPRSENHAEAFFRRNNIPCYLPKYNKTYINSVTAKSGKRYAYKRPPVLVPMFPSYIFAALNLESMSETRRQRSIAQVCLYTDYCEDAFIADLNKVKDFEFLAKNNQIEVRQELQEGTRVVIVRGPFKDWEGVVERRIDKNFLWVRVESIGYSMAMEIVAADCEAVK